MRTLIALAATLFGAIACADEPAAVYGMRLEGFAYPHTVERFQF